MGVLAFSYIKLAPNSAEESLINYSMHISISAPVYQVSVQAWHSISWLQHVATIAGGEADFRQILHWKASLSATFKPRGMLPSLVTSKNSVELIRDFLFHYFKGVQDAYGVKLTFCIEKFINPLIW